MLLLFVVYVNHRPVFGLNPADIVDAFDKIGTVDDSDEVVIERSELLRLLQDKGGCCNQSN